MGIKIEAAAYSSIGSRKNNEDNFYLDGIYVKQEQMDQGGKAALLNTHPKQIYAVFDGMGGGEYGEYASSLSAEQLNKYQHRKGILEDCDNLRRFLTDTSMMIDQFSIDSNMPSGSCGSTAAILVIGDWWYRTAHVGDSRVYLLRDGELKRLTKDQSEVQRLLDAGKITMEEAWVYPRKNVITHHLGMPLKNGELNSVIGDLMELQSEDCFLICSDGVNDSLKDDEIQNCIDLQRSSEEIASDIVRSAEKKSQERGIGTDNVTAVVLKIKQASTKEKAEKRVRKMAAGRMLFGICAALCAIGAIGAAIRVIQML